MHLSRRGEFKIIFFMLRISFITCIEVKQQGPFLKLDIAKAFDSVCWDFLQEVMQQLGFGVKWRNWVSILLSVSASSVLLNGSRGLWFRHFTGLRQRDPLSPVLFYFGHGTFAKNVGCGCI